jgi:hypothetical protein
MERLAKSPAGVSEIAAPFPMALPSLRQPLRVPVKAGLITSHPPHRHRHRQGRGVLMSRKIAAFTPYFTEDQAGQVRAAFLAAGHLEGDASVSDFIVRATMREVKRLQRKHHQGKPWDPAPPGTLRRGQRAKDELQQHDTKN